MITGTVSADYEPLIQLILQDANGQEHEREAVVDTGFTGWLTLPPDVIAAMGFTWREWGAAILADGSQITFNVYNALLVWDGQRITIPVDEVDAEPLIGMRLMRGYRLLVEDVDGGLVQIEHI